MHPLTNLVALATETELRRTAASHPAPRVVRRPARHGAGLLAAACALVAVAPMSAKASTIDYTQGRLVLTAGSEVNWVDVAAAECRFEAGSCMDVTDRDEEIQITPAAREVCSYADEYDVSFVECYEQASFTAQLGGGDDRYQGDASWTGAAVIHFGPGNDEALAPPGRDQLYGEDGNDFLAGGAGNDVLDGGNGDDTLEAPVSQEVEAPGQTSSVGEQAFPGADVITGGPGRDGMSYYLIGAPVSVSLDGRPNDGPNGHGDNVASDIEAIEGTYGADTLSGADAGELLIGLAGDDVLLGNGGNDVLEGDDGNDRLSGDVGDDTLRGYSGDDTLDGGSGRDSFHGDAPPGIVTYRSGTDRILARDGEADGVACGMGPDFAIVDSIDSVSGDCENVDRARIVDPPPARNHVDLNVPRSVRRSVLRRRGLTFQVGCSLGCRVSATAHVRKRKVGAARRDVAAGTRARVRLRLSRKGSKTVRRLKRGTLVLRLRITDPAGTTTASTRRIRIRR
jgi:RTX calcium-binding nonapeptide repeat (4 copies)